MKTKYNRFAISALVAFCLLGLTAAAHAQYAYDIVGLGSLGGVTYPWGINNKGQVVGLSYSSQFQQNHAFLYSSGTIQDVFPQNFAATSNGAAGIEANGINDRGQIIGHSPNGAYVYDPATGDRHDIFSPAQYSDALGINQAGDVVGEFHPSTTHSFLYHSSTGIYEDIGFLPGGAPSATAYAINNAGQITGTAAAANIGAHAFLYSNGVMQDIGTFPGGRFAEGRGINDNGDVVGSSDHGGATPPHAFLYHNGVMKDIGLLHSYDNDSYAYGINNAGDVVGQSGFTGFLYHDDNMVSLASLIDPSLGWSIESATAINERGQIIGYGNQGAFLMTPHAAATPAPGSLLVCGLGGGLLLLRLRGRKRTQA